MKLDKSRAGDKIDGVMALNCAVAEYMTRTAQDPDEIPDDYDQNPMSYNPDDPSIRLMRKLSTRRASLMRWYTRLPSHRSMVDAYWDVEYDHMSFFNRSQVQRP